MLRGLLIEALGKNMQLKELPNLLQIDELEHKSVYYYSLLCCRHNFIGKSCEFITGSMRCKFATQYISFEHISKKIEKQICNNVGSCPWFFW